MILRRICLYSRSFSDALSTILWFCFVHENCQRNVDFAVRQGVPPGGIPIFVGWRSVDFFAFLTTDLVFIYVLVLLWCGEFEMSRVHMRSESVHLRV